MTRDAIKGSALGSDAMLRGYRPEMPERCFYCGSDTGTPSEEHVISAALGCKEVLRVGVCKRCNDMFGHDLEGPFVNALVLFRNFFRIPNREGAVPDLDVSGQLAGDAKRFPVKITGDGRVLIPPHPVSDEKPRTSHEKEYRIFTKKQESVIEQNLRAKHGDLIWRRLEETDVTQIVNVQAEFDAAILCSHEANRTVAKYALNLLAHHYGLAFVTEKFSALKEFVLGKGPDQRVGIFWDPSLLKSLPFATPKHLFIVCVDGAAHRVTVFIWLFSLFPYAVVIEEPAISVDSFWSAAIDPYDATFTPLFVGAIPPAPTAVIGNRFPLPEHGFARQIEKLTLGGLEKAVATARHAMRFIERIRAEHKFGTLHICYHCGRVLEQISDTCKYCRQSPKPNA
jgi:hypothetical protein